MQILFDKNIEFEGNFVNGEMEGDGCCKYPDGIQFFGKWKKNERNG